MKIIQKFQSDDGREFHSENDCKKYEALIITVDKIMSILRPVPRSEDFDGYVQQNIAEFKQVKFQLLEKMKEYSNHKWIQQTIDDDTVHFGWVARIIDEDRDISPLSDAWWRLSCVDKSYREWNQVYFASHPEEGTQVDLTVYE